MYKAEWWSKNRTKSDVKKILAHSSFIVAIVDKNNEQLAAFCRILTDNFCFAYIYDFIVRQEYRGEKVSNLLMTTILNHRSLSTIESIELVCRKEMRAFYKKFGFTTDYGKSVSMRKTILEVVDDIV